jgi:hypothetical protein
MMFQVDGILAGSVIAFKDRAQAFDFGFGLANKGVGHRIIDFVAIMLTEVVGAAAMFLRYGTRGAATQLLAIELCPRFEHEVIDPDSVPDYTGRNTTIRNRLVPANVVATCIHIATPVQRNGVRVTRRSGTSVGTHKRFDMLVDAEILHGSPRESLDHEPFPGILMTR